MADNFNTKAWPQSSLNDLARNRASERIFREGRALPCHVVKVDGAIVTVAFDVDSTPYTLPQVTIPKAESPWLRMPTQVGDKGITMPSSVYIGALSALGAGIAKMSPAFNLSDLIFVPVSNALSPPPNVNAATVQGPDGAIIQTTSGTASSIITNTSGTTLTFGSTTLAIDSSGVTITVNGYTVKITSTGMTIGGIDFATHVHSGVTTGTGDTGPVA